jgi:rhamnose utilization protein RhaD (predicted bifunctional aldolase and dehydrogenase)
VLAMIDQPDMSEQAIEDGLRAAQVDPKASKPSIETLLHAICLTQGQAKFVGHTHAEAVMHLLCSGHGAEPFLQHLFPDAVVVCGRVPMVVPYVDPGMPLAVAFRRSLDRYLQEHATPPKLVLMLNHGIVALGQSATEVLNITMMAQKWARVLAGTMALGQPTFLPPDSVKKLDSRLDEQYRRRQLGQ